MATTDTSEKGLESLIVKSLVEEGGYIGFCDHRVPPNVPLENYVHYLDCVRRVWGRSVNLKPMGMRQAAQVCEKADS